MHAWAVQSSKSFKFRTKKRNTTTIVQQLKLITITNTKMTTKTHLFGALLLLSASSIISTLASVVITEVSDKGTSGVCEENDWIELFNSGADAIDLSDGYILHDDKGPNDPEAFVFPSPTLLGPQEYLLLCNEITTTADPTTLNVGNSQSLPVQVGHPMSPQFGIGGDDTVTLAFIKPEDTTSTTTTNGNTTATTLNAVDRQINPLLYTVISQVRLPNTDDDFDITYALNTETGLYSYTGTPTPGAPNVFTALPTPEEIRARLQTELKAQNDMGTQFFNMDARGDPVPDGMPDVIDMYVTMAPADYQYMLENRTAEQYRPFSGGEVKTVDGELISTFGAGDIRPKGQSSLFLASCLGSDTFPFQLEFNGNSSLYGVKRIYVRNHIGDNSYMRDWVSR